MLLKLLNVIVRYSLDHTHSS